MRKKILLTILGLFLGIFLIEKEDTDVYAAGFIPVGTDIVYVLDDGTFIKDTWINHGSRMWHFDEEGFLQTGIVSIDGVLWELSLNGTAIPILDIASETSAAGTLDNNSLTIPIEATQTMPISEFQQKVYSVIANCTNDSMTQHEKLRACYDYVDAITSYERTYETPSGDWTKPYALQIYTTGRGNCYRYASAFAYLANGLGYETKVITGVIGAARGGYNPHGWVEVNIDGTWYVCDPEMQDVDSKKRDFFLKTYQTYPCKGLTKYQEWAVFF